MKKKKAAEKSAAFEEKELQELDVDELLGKKSEPKKETSVPFYIKNEGKELDELDVSEFFEKDDLPLRIMANEPVFFRDEDWEEENEYPGFGKHFLEILAEDEAKKNKENDLIGAKDYEMLLEQKRKNKEKDLPGYRPGEREESKYLFSPTVRGSITRTNNMYNVYKSGEEWLMSEEGGDDLVKGFINNVRSSIGSGAEDFAYLLNDIAPWYTPAAKVIENNMAGEIEEQAQRNFGNARASGVNGNVVDFLDSTSKGLGYNIFGVNAGNYMQPLGEGFEEYRRLREQGYSKEEATKRSLVNTGVSLAGDKVLEKGGKMLNKHFPKGKVSGLTAGTDEFVDNVYDYNYNKNKEYHKGDAFLQKKLDYSIAGENSFVPEGASFKNIKTIAGNGSEKPIRDVDRLVNDYGGKKEEWKKQVGLIESDKYKFDIHWYERDSIQYDVKLKGRSIK